MLKQYNAALIGYGGMGRHHVIHLSLSDRIVYTGVYDIDEKRMELAQKEKEGIHLYSSAEEIFADKDIDIVTIATPNNFHKDLACAAMRAGKAVVVEKPVAMSSAEFEEMIQVSKETGMLLTVHQNRRRDADYKLVKEIVTNGTLGDVFEIESKVVGSRGIPDGWRQYSVAGGGMMLDWGVHLIDQLVMLFYDKKIISVFCEMFHVNYNECDDGFRLNMKFENGPTCIIEIGTSHFIQTPRWYIAGNMGGLIVENWNCDGKIIRAKDQVTTWEEEIIQTKAGPTKTMAPRRKETTEETIFNPDDYQSDHWVYYENLAGALDGTEKPFVKLDEALRVMKLMEACFESDRTKQAIICEI